MDVVSREGLREAVAHGDMRFPTCLYKVPSRDTYQILPYHWHAEFEFIYMVAGRAVFQVEDERVELAEGEALLVLGEQVHSGFAIDTEFTEYHAVVFDPRLIASGLDVSRDFVDAVRSGASAICTVFRESAQWHRELLFNARRLISALGSSSPGHEMEARGRLLLCFALIQEHGVLAEGRGRNPSNARAAQRLKAVIEHIHRNYQSTMSLAGLAGVAGLSPSQFCRFFRGMTGRTPTDYINYYRVERAAEAVARSTASIMDIGFDSGFGNFSYFIKTFRRYKGCTPTEFRCRGGPAPKATQRRGATK